MALQLAKRLMVYEIWATNTLQMTLDQVPRSSLFENGGLVFRSVHGMQNHMAVASQLWLHRFLGQDACTPAEKQFTGVFLFILLFFGECRFPSAMPPLSSVMHQASSRVTRAQHNSGTGGQRRTPRLTAYQIRGKRLFLHPKRP
jgi:hypothetical protein